MDELVSFSFLHGCSGTEKCFSETLSSVISATHSSMVWHHGLGSFSVYLGSRSSLGNSKLVCSVVEYLYPVWKCWRQSIYLFLHAAAALRSAGRLVALGPLQLFRRVIIVLPSCLQKMEVFLEVQFCDKRATAVPFNWPPSGRGKAAVALLISHDQCQLSAWHRAPSPQRLLITWAVAVMEVTTCRHGAPVMVHLPAPQPIVSFKLYSCTDLVEWLLPSVLIGLGLTLQFYPGTRSPRCPPYGCSIGFVTHSLSSLAQP